MLNNYICDSDNRFSFWISFCELIRILSRTFKPFKMFFGISVSHQTIKNWLFVNKNILKFNLGR